MTKKVKCRYGIEYKVTAYGERGAQYRLFDLLGHCCCWVWHNHKCKEPRNEKLKDCGTVCKLWNSKKAPFCEKKGKKNENQVQSS